MAVLARAWPWNAPDIKRGSVSLRGRFNARDRFNPPGRFNPRCRFHPHGRFNARDRFSPHGRFSPPGRGTLPGPQGAAERGHTVLPREASLWQNASGTLGVSAEGCG